MKVWVFVEGESDRIALTALWQRWQAELQKSGWGIHVIPLDNKTNFFKKIGARAAEKITHDAKDVVVGMPDLYPYVEYSTTEYKHGDVSELQAVQKRLVLEALQLELPVFKATMDWIAQKTGVQGY